MTNTTGTAVEILATTSYEDWDGSTIVKPTSIRTANGVFSVGDVIRGTRSGETFTVLYFSFDGTETGGRGKKNVAWRDSATNRHIGGAK